MSYKYILDDKHNVIAVDSIQEWGRWFEESKNRRVANTVLPNGFRVSTVFLGLDHSFSLEDPARPIVFETMVFNTKEEGTLAQGNDLDIDRYATWDEAVKGHNDMVKKWSDHE